MSFLGCGTRGRRIVSRIAVSGALAILACDGGEARTPEHPPDVAGSSIRHHALVQQKVGFYAVFLPPGYDAPKNRNRRYRVIVILHGLGSNEMIHGRLAARLAIDDAIFVAPRAPHASHEAFLELRQPGFSAWPQYPESWGPWDGASFPDEELAGIDIPALYTDWIADTIADVRKRYRSDPAKVLVVGHSQGATMALSFALRHPELVAAFFGHAGWYELEPLDNKTADVLKTHGVVPFITHDEGDAVVSIAQSRKLLAFFRRFEVPYRELLRDGGDHSFGPEIVSAAQSFLRSQMTPNGRDD